MTETITQRLEQLDLVLPEISAAPAGIYRPALNTGSQLFVSGQLPLKDGLITTLGQVGGDVTIRDAQEAAKHCAIQVLAQAKVSLGSLERVEHLAKITVFVSSAPGFSEQHVVANAASELFTRVLGSIGEHSRSAVGVAGLPFNAAVEVEAIFNIAPTPADLQA